MNKNQNVVWFNQVDKDDVALVGGKGANLGEMTKAGFPVPNGFIITAQAYSQFLEENKLNEKVQKLLDDINLKDEKSVEQISKKIKSEILKGKVPKDLTSAVFKFYRTLGGLKDALVAVRSSATAEDLPDASFAGQQETSLNIKGEANLFVAIKHGWASLFTARALYYRYEKHIAEKRIGIAIVVQKMVQSDTSGVIFTVDPVTNDKNKITIEAVFGLGELIVQGEIQPDHYEVDKQTFKITNSVIAKQEFKLIKVAGRDKKVKVAKSSQEKQKLGESEIKKLAEIAKNLEKHYYFPQDIEFAVEKGKIFIVQTRPVTTLSQKSKVKSQKYDELGVSSQKSEVILIGDPASPGIATGPVKIIHKASEISKIETGDILVAPKTNPDYVPAMKKAAGIVTDFGGRTSHAAIVSRELGIPAVVGTKNATSVLKTHMQITMNGRTGEIFKGRTVFKEAKVSKLVSGQSSEVKTATRLYVNLSDPERAKTISRENVDGVGLLRAEFMLTKIGTHPKKLIREHKQKRFINFLTDSLRVFCESFHPRPIIYRATDFKTNEYKNMPGGKLYEPDEENPMIGYRGAFRYMHDPEVFNLELEAIKIVREDLNLKNLWLMIPFVRTVNELIAIKKLIEKKELFRHDFKLFMMVEVPSNVILIEEFIKVGIDGISIGSNDLTQLILGVDRDNSEIQSEFDERNPAVLWAIERVLKAAKLHHIMASICGEAPTVHPDLIEKFVEWGITSISVEADSINSSRLVLAEAEKKFISKRRGHYV